MVLTVTRGLEIFNSFHAGKICIKFCRLLIFFFKIDVFKNTFMNTMAVSNSLDQDQARLNVMPDLCPNCLQRSSAEDSSRYGVNFLISLCKHISKP